MRGAGAGDGAGRAGGAVGLVEDKVAIRGESTTVASAGVNPAGKLTSIIAGMAAGADSIDDLDVIRSGGMPRLFGGVYAPATLGQFLREFTHGHTAQLASVARAHLVDLVERTGSAARHRGAGVHRHRLAAAPGLRARQAGRQLRAHQDRRAGRCCARGLSPLATTICTDTGAPVVAGIRLRAGKAGSGKGAASMVPEAIGTARAAGATGADPGPRRLGLRQQRGHRRCVKAGVRFSFVLAKNPAVNRAIATIAEDAWTPVHYPGAVIDPDTGELISDAEVAEVEFTAFASTKHPVTARLIVRRVRDRAKTDELFPVWRYHPFFTNSTEPTDRRPTSPTAGTRSSRPCSPT